MYLKGEVKGSDRFRFVYNFQLSISLTVRDRVMMSHHACISRISRVLTVVSLQRLKMEAFIPAPADLKCCL